jgi:hypothetical protein
MFLMSAQKPNYIPVACLYADSRILETKTTETQDHEIAFDNSAKSIA